MSLVTIQRSPTPPDNLDSSSTSHYDESSGSKSQSEDFFASKATAILQNQIGRRRSSVINEGDAMQFSLKKAVGLLRKEDCLKLICNLEKVNSRIEGFRYFCVLLTNGKQDTDEYLILGIDISFNNATIGLVLPICQDMSVTLDGDGGFKVKNKDGEKLFKPTSVHALWSIVQLLNKACFIAHNHNYYIGGLSHTWIGFYSSKISSNRAQIAEWNRMIDANTIINSNLAPKSAIGEFVIGTHVDEVIQKKDEIRKYLKELMRDEDMDNVTVTFLREKLQENLSFNLKEYRSFIAEEILIIYGQMDSASEILPYLFLGSTYNASNLEELLKNKITHILNVTRESENFFREKFTYHNVEVFDVDETNLLNYFNDCFQFISEAKYAQSVCLVHCQRGISRSASVVIAYLMKEYNWTRDKAIEEVKNKRDCIQPNESFMLQLKTYEGILKAKQDFNSLIFKSQRQNQTLPNQKRTKIMSFPNEFYQINENDNGVDSPTNSCPTPQQRQSLSTYERVVSYTNDIPFTNTSVGASAAGIDDSLMNEAADFDINQEFNVKSAPGGIDLNENILEVNDSSIFLSEDISNISENVKDTYQREIISSDTKNDISPSNIDCSAMDCNANDPCYKSQRNDFAKRSLRLKGDASWIKQPSEVVEGNLRNDTCHEHCDDDMTQYFREENGAELEVTYDLDIDQQSLRPVKELLTKYSTTENLI